MSSGVARRGRNGDLNYQVAARRCVIPAGADAQHATSTCHTGGTRIATLSCSQVAAHRSRRRPQSGSALLAVVLLGGAVAAMSVALLGDAATLTAETRTHRDAQCARYAALGGLAAGTAASGRPALVDARVSALRVERVLLSPTWCVLRATAACGSATRTLEHTLPDPAACR